MPEISGDFVYTQTQTTTRTHHKTPDSGSWRPHASGSAQKRDNQDPRDLAYLGDDLKTRCIQLHRDDEPGHLVVREPPGVDSKGYPRDIAAIGDISEY